MVFELEEHAPEMAGLVLIAAPARMGGENRGTVAVIGPKRMQYERTMNAVGVHRAGAGTTRISWMMAIIANRGTSCDRGRLRWARISCSRPDASASFDRKTSGGLAVWFSFSLAELSSLSVFDYVW